MSSCTKCSGIHMCKQCLASTLSVIDTDLHQGQAHAVLLLHHSCWSSRSPSVMCLAIGDVDTARTAAAMTGESMSASVLQPDLPPVIRKCLQHCRESINTSIGCLNHTDHLSLAMQVFERLVTCRWCCRYNKPHGQKQVQNHH